MKNPGTGGGFLHDTWESCQKDEWLTPPEIVHALGDFDLDPCAPVRRPWSTATHHYTVLDNGLTKPWFSRVWMNPPYGRETGIWLNKLAVHGDGIALVFARTETSPADSPRTLSSKALMPSIQRFTVDLSASFLPKRQVLLAHGQQKIICQ